MYLSFSFTFAFVNQLQFIDLTINRYTEAQISPYKKSYKMNIWLKRIFYALLFAIAEVAIIYFLKLKIVIIAALFLLFGFLIKALEHRNFGWGMIIGTIIFVIFTLTFGWLFMEGWVKPSEYFAK
jgi:hypothetical protein